MVKKSVKESISPQELEKWKKLERMWKGVDMSRFWQDVVKAAAPEMEALRIAQAKSKGGAAHHVLF